MYEQAWIELRRRRRLAGFLIIAFFGILAVAFLSPRLPGSAGVYVLAPLVMIWPVMWLYQMCKLSLFKCPRCGNRFNMAWPFQHNPLAAKCVHCGLKKYST